MSYITLHNCSEVMQYPTRTRFVLCCVKYLTVLPIMPLCFTCRLSGVWSEYLTNDSTSQKLWEAAPEAPDPTRYNLTQFAIQLNEITAGLKVSLPPTDCRLRPDQAALEQGLFDKVCSGMTCRIHSSVVLS